MILEQLRARGFKGELGAHLIPWFSKSNTGNYHPFAGYNSNDPVIIDKQIRVALANGVTVFFITYQGPFKTFQHQCAMEVARQCALWRNMKFAFVMDPWATDKIMRADGKTPDIDARQAQMAKVMMNPDVQSMLLSPAYIPERAVLDFNTGTDYSKLVGPMTPPWKDIWQLNKGYSWPHVASDGVDPIALLKRTHALPTMKAPGFCISFFDGGMPIGVPMGGAAFDPYTRQELNFNAQNWGTLAKSAGPARYAPDRAGNYFFDQLDTITDWSKFPYAVLVTWNDYNERTAWEVPCSIRAGIRVG